jgi:IS30 family transposase
MKNKQLTSTQRYQIEVLLQTGTAIKKVAQLLETDKSTIYREIKRNKHKRNYRAKYAQQLCTERKERYLQARKLTHGMEKFIREKVTTEQWSPKQIVEYAQINNLPIVSHELIYQLIRQDKLVGLIWHSNLRPVICQDFENFLT